MIADGAPPDRLRCWRTMLGNSDRSKRVQEMRKLTPVITVALLAAIAACNEAPAPAPEPESEEIAEVEEAVESAPVGPDRAALRERARSVFGELPDEAASETNPVTEEKITLGRMLFFDPRFSKNHDISCNSCHDVANFGVDGEPTSPGHKGQRGGRNSPTVYNAALHIAQFWDGREPDVEAQAKGPVLNPIEMAMPSEEAVVAVLKSIPGYAPLFTAAFPDDEDPINYDNMARAIGAFERRLITADHLDAFVSGQDTAMSDEDLAGLEEFLDAGCITCHMGSTIGGGMYRKLGLVKPYSTADPGRFEVTGDEADRFVFKVPSLRNIAMTGPYFHDGSIASLQEAIRLMAKHQLGIELSDEQVARIETFLGTLTGTVEPEYITAPELPESGPDTPAPDPS
jgi:cytochrome c peroxidase